MSDKNQELKEAWQWVAGTTQGRLVLNDIMRMAGLRGAGVPGQTNAIMVMNGKRQVAEFIDASVDEFCADDYLKLVNERRGTQV